MPHAVEMSKTFTLEDIKQHTTRQDCWVVIENKVYDVTKFLDEHPGGGDLLIQSSGEFLFELAATIWCVGMCIHRSTSALG